jgi:hypothetical protein
MKSAILKCLTLLGSTAFAVTVVDVGRAVAGKSKKVPEPTSLILLTTGLGGLGWWMRKRK